MSVKSHDDGVAHTIWGNNSYKATEDDICARLLMTPSSAAEGSAKGCPSEKADDKRDFMIEPSVAPRLISMPLEDFMVAKIDRPRADASGAPEALVAVFEKEGHTDNERHPSGVASYNSVNNLGAEEISVTPISAYKVPPPTPLPPFQGATGKVTEAPYAPGYDHVIDADDGKKTSEQRRKKQKSAPTEMLQTTTVVPPCESVTPSHSVEEQMVLDEKHPNWTVGSRFHAKGLCKPCGLFHTNSCVNGNICFYCHLCDGSAIFKSKPFKQSSKKGRVHAV